MLDIHWEPEANVAGIGTMHGYLSHFLEHLTCASRAPCHTDYFHLMME